MSFSGGGGSTGVSAHDHSSNTGEGGTGPIWIGVVMG